MSLPATDAFTGTNGTTLQAYSANWTPMTPTSIEIQGNAAETAVGGGTGAVCLNNADVYNNDQYAKTTLTGSANTGGQIGPAVRCSGNGATRKFYAYEVFKTGREFYKIVNGTYTGLGANVTSNTAADGDVPYLEAIGTAITPKYNGVTDSGMGAVTDSSLASGSAGITGWDDGSASVRANDWEGGNTGGGGGGTNMPISQVGPGGGFAGRARGWAA